MADLSYTVDVNVNPAIRSLDSLNTRIDKVAKSFGGLRTALLGLGLATLGASAIRMADGLQDLSNATGIAVGSLVELKNALASSGGQIDQMPAAINQFVRSIDDAAQGSIKAQQAFKDAGVSLDDLRKLGERDLMIKTLEGISQIDDAGRRASLMMEKFGKSFKTVDPGELANKLRMTAGEGDRYAASIKRAADLNDNLERASGNVQLALLMAFEPIIKKVNSFNTAMEESGIKAEGLVNAIKVLGAVMAAAFALSFGLSVVKVLGQIGRGLTVIGKEFGFIAKTGKGAMSGIFAATSGLMVAIRGAVAILAVFGTAIYAASQLFDDFGAVASNALARIVEGIGSMVGLLAGGTVGAAFGSAFGPIGTILGGVAGAFAGDKLADLFGVPALIDKAKQARIETEKMAQAVKDADLAETAKLGRLYPAKKPERDVDTKAQENAIRGVKEISAEFVKQQQQLQYRIGLEAEIAGYGEDEKSRILAQADLTKSYADIIEQLVKKKQTLTKDEEYLIPVINEQIASASKLYETQRQGLDAVITKQQMANYNEKQREMLMEQITKQMERQSTLGDQIRSAYDKLKDVEFEGAQMKRSPLEKQFAQIQEDARKAAREASLAFAAGFEGMDLSVAQTKELADGLEKIAQSYGKIAEAQMANIEQSRTFSQGWKEAYDSYIENASNAATQASDVFSSVTSNMNSAIDNFVNTGKLSFGGLARSIIADLAKIELKAAAAKIFSGGGGGFGGIFSGIASLFGFANGGNPPVNKPSIVGEKGPELFIPKTQGTIIPNGATPATGGNNTYITNNVTAMDAKSVAQLFAENRKTLFGTVEMARKEMSYAR